ncbi:MAG: hypothetical protein ACLU84_02450 [Clostridia bacterium]
MNTLKKYNIILLLIVILLMQSFYFPTLSLAKEEDTISLDVTLSRDEKDPNFIRIIAKDTQYKITDLKYVHKFISLDQISYFEESHEDIHTFSITPSMYIEESFPIDGYGAYTVYAKNTYGNRFLSRITLRDPALLPSLTVSQNQENPLHLHIQATSKSTQNLTTLKIAKKETYQETIDFKTQGTVIPFASSKQIDLLYTGITEPGIYAIYVADGEGYSTTTTVYVSEQKTPITAQISDMDDNRKIQIQAVDAICSITTIKIAKKEEIEDFDDFQTKGVTIPITPSQTINTSYTIPTDGTYIIYIADEIGYQKMIQKRFVSEEKVMNVTVKQDADNPRKLTMTATNTIANIVEMKVAIGDTITIEYFQENGEILPITPGKIVEANYLLSQNAVLNVYVKDEDGYSYMTTKTITNIDDPVPPQAPSISLTQNVQNPKQIDVLVRGLDAYIRKVKWAPGKQDIAYFATNGTQIGTESIGKIVQTHFSISQIGTYTVYSIDNQGSQTVEYIQITNIEEVVAPDTTPPTITGVQNQEVYTKSVTPICQDEHLTQVVLTRNEEIVTNYTNGMLITEDGIYELLAVDEAGNQTTVSFTIDKTAPTIQVMVSKPENKQVNVKIHIEEPTTCVKTLKVANGQQDISYFQESGQEIPIPTTNQKLIIANWPITQNGTYTIYAQDLAGNGTVYSFKVNTIEEEPEPTPEDTTPPIIEIAKQVAQDNKKVELTLHITDTQSVIAKAKVAVGKQTLSYFKEAGEVLELTKTGNTATTTFGILQNGWYTIYVEDMAGNATIKPVEITDIQDEKPNPEPVPDEIPPTILGVEDKKVYYQAVTPTVQDDNLLQVTLTKDGNVVKDYQNGDTITTNGKYVLTAIDRAGNQTIVTFTIAIEAEKPNTNTITNIVVDTNQITNHETTSNIQNTENTASGTLPQTGDSVYIVIAILCLGFVCVYFYNKYKSL